MKKSTLWVFGSLLMFYSLPFVYSQEIALSQIMEKAGEHFLVQQAGIELAVRRENWAAVSGWLGSQAELTPFVRYDDKTGEIDLAETELQAGLSFPLGTGDADKEKKISARELVEIAEKRLTEAYGQAYTELFGLYASAYSAQENRAVAETEALYYRQRLESVRLTAVRGLSTVSELTDAEAEYQAAEERAIQAGVDARIAWFELAYAAGLEAVRPGAGVPSSTHTSDPESAALDIPVFSAPDLAFLSDDLPLPGILMDSARKNTSALLLQRQRLAETRRALETYSGMNLNISPKVQYATPDASASLSYGTANGSLNLGLGWFPYVNPDTPTGASTPPDNAVSISIMITGAINPNSGSERKALEMSVLLEEKRLSAMEQGSDLMIRSKYAVYLKAKDSLAAAERAARMADEIEGANRARQTLGQLAPEDETAGKLSLLRAEYAVAKAKAAAGQAYLEVLSSANAWELTDIRFEEGNLEGAGK